MAGRTVKGFAWAYLVVFGPQALADAREEYTQLLQQHGRGVLQSYHLPRSGELSYWGIDAGSFFYKSTDVVAGDGKAPFWTKGDFNRDGVTDRAYILFSDRSGEARVLVFVSAGERKYQVLNVGPASKSMGVDTTRLVSGGHALRVFEFEGNYEEYYVWSDGCGSFVTCDRASCDTY